jgi:hypothetical protein
MVTATLREVIIVSTQILSLASPTQGQADPVITGGLSDQGVQSLGPAPNYVAPL